MEGDLRHAVGRNLRSFRTALGLTQEAFAHHFGLQRSWVGSVERAERNLTITSLEQLAQQLGIDIFALVAREADAVIALARPVEVASASQGPSLSARWRRRQQG